MAEPSTAAPQASGSRSGDGRSSSRRGPGTREAIDAAALELFARRGYHATSMRAIAAAADVRPAAIYHWYESKEAILTSLQDEFMQLLTERVVAAAAEHERPALRLAAVVREHVVFHGVHRKAAFVTDSEIRALESGPKAALIAQRDAYQDRFHEIIRDGVRDGSLRTSNARVATYAILLQCTGVALWFNPDDPLSLEQVAELHVELVLGSVGASPELIVEAIEAVAPRAMRSGGAS